MLKDAIEIVEADRIFEQVQDLKFLCGANIYIATVGCNFKYP